MAKQRRARPKATTAQKKARSRKAAAPKAADSLLESRRTTYLEAVACYEQGLEALQQRDFQRAATAFQTVLERYPDEREMHERARLYLNVCSRETSPPAPGPETPEELVYAATLALNAGAPGDALTHLQRAVALSPDDDRVHYMLAVAHSQQSEPEVAIRHLGQAIDLDPENRGLARQEPDFDTLRDIETFRRMLERPAAPPTRRRSRRPPR